MNRKIVCSLIVGLAVGSITTIICLDLPQPKDSCSRVTRHQLDACSHVRKVFPPQVQAKQSCCRKFALSLTPIPLSVCDENDEGLIYASVEGGVGPYAYWYSTDGKNFSEIVDDAPDAISFSIVKNGTYTIKVVDDNQCESEQTITITNECAPANSCSTMSLSVVSIPVSSCDPNEINGLVVASVFGGNPPYSYFVSTDQKSFISYDPSYKNPEEFDAPNGTFYFKVEDSSSSPCTSAITQVTINNPCVPTPQC